MKKGIILFLVASVIGFSVPKKIFKSENSKQETFNRQPSNIKFSENARKQVPEGETKIRRINNIFLIFILFSFYVRFYLHY